MSENEKTLSLKRFGDILGVLLFLGLGLYFLIGQKNWAMALLLFCGVLLCGYQVISSSLTLANHNYVEFDAVCTDIKRPIMGYGATSSLVYTFKILDDSILEQYNIPEKHFELQFATKSIRESAKESKFSIKPKYQKDTVYSLMFKGNKNTETPLTLSNTNFLNISQSDNQPLPATATNIDREIEENNE